MPQVRDSQLDATGPAFVSYIMLMLSPLSRMRHPRPRLRYSRQRVTALQGAVLRIFLSAVQRCLRKHSPACRTTAQIGALALVQRFGASLKKCVDTDFLWLQR